MNSCFGPLYGGLFSHPPSVGTLFSCTGLEIIQDLDLYFIRQIAHSLQEYDLEQKIDLEIKMREGTTKLLAACKHSNQSLEAAKSLLTSNERMSAYMGELQHRKTRERERRIADVPSGLRVRPSKARVSVSEIRMPLIWKDSDHFKNKGDYRRFAVFCLLKIGTEIYDTVMVNSVDRRLTDITFDDVIVFNRIPPDFEFRLEVYSHVLHDDLSIASTTRKIKKKISNSVSRTIGRKLAASLKDELNCLDLGPKFDLVAHATLRLSDSSDNICTHDLVLENVENPNHQLPLFGHFCCRLAVQPECMVEEMFSSYLGVVQQMGRDVSSCRRFWCSLKNFQLSFWARAEDAQVCPPVLVIAINKDSRLRTDSLVNSYPCSFRVVNIMAGRTQEHLLAAENDMEQNLWIAHIRQHCRDHELWGQSTHSIMDIPSPAPCRLPVFFRYKQGSLYDETPLWDSPDPSSHSGSILQESNHRLSPPSIRSRSSSTSSASSSVSGSRHFPFFHFRKQSRDMTYY